MAKQRVESENSSLSSILDLPSSFQPAELHPGVCPATLRRVNRLTKQELTVLLVAVGLFLLGLATKVFRESRPMPAAESSEAAPK